MHKGKHSKEIWEWEILISEEIYNEGKMDNNSLWCKIGS